MIQATRLNGTIFTLNSELIEQIESAPDTVITLTTGNNILVKEPVDEIVRRICAYRARIHAEAAERRPAAAAYAA